MSSGHKWLVQMSCHSHRWLEQAPPEREVAGPNAQRGFGAVFMFCYSVAVARKVITRLEQGQMGIEDVTSRDLGVL